MAENSPNYNREFFKSVHHAWLGLFTIGAGVLGSSIHFQPLYAVLGATAYIIGWIYLPGMPFFKRWVDRRHDAAKNTAERAEVEEFIKRRQRILGELSPRRRDRYEALAKVCDEIESAGADTPLNPGDPAADPRLRKLDELMWTYLRMLSIEESLDRFLESEREEDVPRLVNDAEQEVAALGAEIERLKKENRVSSLDAKQRLLTSRLERLEVLQKRLQRLEQAQANLALVISEQERLDQQIKLIRADAIASKNAQTLTARIDATVEHLDQTNRWLAEMDEFKDLVGDLPATGIRIGFKPVTPPPIIGEDSPAKRPMRAKERQ